MVSPHAQDHGCGAVPSWRLGLGRSPPNRPAWQELMSRVQPGDAIVVAFLDRLRRRNTRSPTWMLSLNLHTCPPILATCCVLQSGHTCRIRLNTASLVVNGVRSPILPHPIATHPAFKSLSPWDSPSLPPRITQSAISYSPWSCRFGPVSTFMATNSPAPGRGRPRNLAGKPCSGRCISAVRPT